MDPARHDSSSTSPCPTMVSSARARMEHLNRFLPRPVVAPLQIVVERAQNSPSHPMAASSASTWEILMATPLTCIVSMMQMYLRPG